MPERDAGQRRDLELPERRALGGREAADLLLREGDVARELVADLRLRGRDRRVVDDEARRVPAVELARVAPDRTEPVALDPPEHLRHGPAHLLGRRAAVERSLLEVAGHAREDSVRRSSTSGFARSAGTRPSSTWITEVVARLVISATEEPLIPAT